MLSVSDPIVWIIPALILTFGLATVVMSILGCTGMAIENKRCSISYFLIQIIIIFCEIAVGGFWFWRCSNIKSLIVTKSSFGAYNMDHTMQWTQMQIELDCCGMKSAYDYVDRNFTVPKECCLLAPDQSTLRSLIMLLETPCEAAYVLKKGCDDALAKCVEEERIMIAVFLFGGAVMKILMFGASFFIPFEEISEEVGWSPIGSLIWGKTKDQELKTIE